MKAHVFVVRCSRCGLTVLLKRPRRVLGSFKAPDDHGQGGRCPGQLHVLHYRERELAIRAAEGGPEELNARRKR